MTDLSTLLQTLDYQFADPSYLDVALTHRSAGGENNERLEFLGDASLNLIISEDLYRRFPDIREGELSRIRAALVNGKALAAIARELGLGEHLQLGAGERSSGGHRRESILADALEAVIGAIYQDGGFEACRRVVLVWYRTRLDALDPNASHKDPKTRLQEFLQARKQPLPDYQLADAQGQQHAQTFVVACRVAMLEHAVLAEGRSRRKAEQAAAQQALDLLEKHR